MVHKLKPMSVNKNNNLSVSTKCTGRRQPTLSRSSGARRLFEFEDGATISTNSTGSSKDITVQNPHSRHCLPELSYDDVTSCRHDPWYFSSNHVLINQERVERGLSPLHRRRKLDEKARDLAKNSAEKGKLKRLPIGYKGNVSRGSTIRAMHNDMMMKEGDERKKILSEKYNAFGVGTHKGEDGILYLVQLFEKTRIDQ